jgi:hypothetical protein
MSIPIGNPIPHKPKQNEYSQQRSQRDAHSPATAWKDHNAVATQINSITDVIAAMRREMASYKLRQMTGFDFHPFKIYNVPDSFRPSTDSGSFHTADSWRTFKVRNGCVLTKIVATSSFVAGTDEVLYVDSDILPTPIEKNDIVADNTVDKFYFWIQDTVGLPGANPTGSFILRYGPNPATISTGNPIPWTTFPSASSINFPIGYVDCKTSASVNQAFVRQWQRTDIVTTPGHYITMSVCIDGVNQIFNVDAYPSGSSVT